ncbi:MAG: RNA polymerase sigma factor [Vicinamibacterales bacterium]
MPVLQMSTSSGSRTMALPLIAGRAEAPARASTAEETVLRLFDLHAARLRRHACRTGLTPDAADDVVQEAFMALFRHLQNGGNADNLPGWLVQVSFRLALKARQRSSRQSAQVHSLDDAGIDPVDSGLTAEARLLERQRRRRVSAIVQALPEQDRRCLSMRAEGATYRRIAAELGMSLGGVAKVIARAAARLSHAVKG